MKLRRESLCKSMKVVRRKEVRRTNWRYRHDALLARAVLQLKEINKEIEELKEVSKYCIVKIMQYKRAMSDEGRTAEQQNRLVVSGAMMKVTFC